MAKINSSRAGFTAGGGNHLQLCYIGRIYGPGRQCATLMHVQLKNKLNVTTASESQVFVAASSSPSPVMSDERLDEVLKLVYLLPTAVRKNLENHPQLSDLLEVVMDLGRPPYARFPKGDVQLADTPVLDADLQAAVANCGEFGGDNRAGIDRTLHRISCIRNRAGKIVGLTARVGRSIEGSADMISDLATAGRSILLLGRPGVGKTTAIREISRLLADESQRRVIIVDTSNEIGGDGDIPHKGVGAARRMQVPQPEEQHRVMIEAVENHMPQVIVIDEIGTAAEADAARTIAQRGVQLVATAHGNELENVMKNPSLDDLVGGICSVTLGDEEAKRRGVQKSILERESPPTFDVAVEMVSRDRWLVHPDVATAVDALLAGREAHAEVRERDADGRIWRYPEGETTDYEDESDAEREDAAEALGDLVDNSRASRSRRSSSSSLKPSSASLLQASNYYEEKTPSSSTQSRSTSSKSSSRRDIETQPFPAAALAAARGGGLHSEFASAAARPDALAVYLYGVPGSDIRSVAESLRMGDAIRVADKIEDADAVLATRPKLKNSAWIKEAAKIAGIPIYSVRDSSIEHVVRAVRTLLGVDPSPGAMFTPSGQRDGPAKADPRVASGRIIRPETSIEIVKKEAKKSSSPLRRNDPALERETSEGLKEAEIAAQIVIQQGQPAELLPRPPSVLGVQATLLVGMGLEWELAGWDDEQRRLRVLPKGFSRSMPEDRDGDAGKAPGAREKEYW